MSADWESTLRSWVRPPSDAEDQKRDRTETQVRDALASYVPLPNASIRVFAQGSYKNNTNVRLDYDVDLAVEYQEGEPFPTTAPSIASTDKRFSAKNLTNEQLGLVTLPTPFDPKGFKDHVEAALVERFGRSMVERRPKCIKVQRGATTLPADVVPCFPYRRYDSPTTMHRGVRIFPETGPSIVNFPQQHYDNGCAKNNRTARRFKRMVRALKRMENELLKRGRIPEEVPSFLIECLVYNVPDTLFGHATYLEDFTAVTSHIWYRTYNEERCTDWEEVNGLKYLFRGAWNREQASDLAWEAWQMVKP